MAFDPADIAAPLALHRETIPAEWIDYNGHANVAFYVLAFDHNADALFDHIGLDAAYRAAEQVSTFALEVHVSYLRELREGDRVRVSTQLLDCDDKRIHYCAQMVDEGADATAAVAEWVSIHMDMAARRPAPFRPPVRERLEAILAAHRDLPVPPQVGRVMGLRRAKAG